MTPPPLVQAAQELLQFLMAQDRAACLIGGMVVARWGEPRGTQDVDATVLVDFGEEIAVLDLLLSKFRSRDPLPAQRAEIGRLVLLTASNGVDLDVSFAAFPFEMEVLQRASDWRVTPDVSLRTCSAEDLLVYKLVAARPIDIHDVQAVVSRMGDTLDLERVRLWGGRFAEIVERPELLEPFEAALRKPGRLR
jgi:hypothetical protein